jgi:uncharacterized membrane protein YidH (DUF202 family)
MPEPAAQPVTPAAKLTAEENAMILNTMQLLLAEKRTALSGLRTGIAIFAFPLSVLSVLIATSKLYETEKVMHWLLPLVGISVGLLVLAIYLVHRSILLPLAPRPRDPGV